MRYLTTLILCLFLSACLTVDKSVFKEVDYSEKTVTVPAGTFGLLKPIKKYLNESGWKTTVYRAPDVTEGTNDGEVNLKTYNTFHTRYNLLVNQTKFDLCLNFEPALHFDISLIDNKDGTEVFSLSGSSCWSAIEPEFKELMK